MAILRVLLMSSVLFSAPSGADVELIHELGVKHINRDLRGQDESDSSTRPYYQLGLYNSPVKDEVTYGVAVNYSPNTMGSNTESLFHLKMIDFRIPMGTFGDDLLHASFGALRYSRNTPAWGYSIGFGYSTDLFGLPFQTNLSWSRTDTELGGLASESGAKDNFVWLDLGIQF